MLDMAVYTFVYSILAASAVGVLLAMALMGRMAYENHGVWGVVAQVAGWASFVIGFIVPICYIENPVWFLVIMLTFLVASITLLFWDAC